MKRLLLLTSGLMLILGCHKAEEITPSPNISVVNHVVYLDSGNRITKIRTTDANNKFSWEANYSYTDSVILKITNFTGTTKSVSKFKMGHNGFAEYSIDTTLYDPNAPYRTLNSDSIRYTYDSDGYLVRSVKYSFYFDYSGDSINYVIDSSAFTFLDGDLVSYNGVKEYKKGQETYTFYDINNKADILYQNYCDGIVGKPSLHLIKKEIFKSDYAFIKPCEYDYKYTLNSNGYVTERAITSIGSFGPTINTDKYIYIVN